MVTSFNKAQTDIMENITTLSTSSSPLLEASGQVLAEDIYAPHDLPLWNNSAMDGFAVHSADCNSCFYLTICGCISAGDSAEGIIVQTGSAIRIMTGAPIPDGCDAVIPFENTEQDGENILIKFRIKPGQHVRQKGEDIQSGDLAILSGTILGPSEISLLACFGKTSVSVYRQANVAILATGSELIEPGDKLTSGKIVNGNSLALAAAIKEVGAKPIILGIAKDDPADLKKKISEGLNADVLLTSAGISVGDKDFVKETLEKLQVKTIFWKVKLKPGQPTMFGLWQKKPVFSLPGNPVSTLLTFDQFVRPALLKMMGHQHTTKLTVKAILQSPHTKKADRVQLLRVLITKHGDQLIATSAGDQNTGILTTSLRANAIAILPAEKEYFPAGDTIQVQLLRTGQHLDAADLSQLVA
jgi:molybdopterin molybdotransferase